MRFSSIVGLFGYWVGLPTDSSSTDQEAVSDAAVPGSGKTCQRTTRQNSDGFSSDFLLVDGLALCFFQVFNTLFQLVEFASHIVHFGFFGYGEKA